MAHTTSKTPKRLTGPTAKHNLRLDAPIERWDEAAPIGNGLLGALLWGKIANFFDVRTALIGSAVMLVPLTVLAASIKLPGSSVPRV